MAAIFELFGNSNSANTNVEGRQNVLFRLLTHADGWLEPADSSTSSVEQPTANLTPNQDRSVYDQSTQSYSEPVTSERPRQAIPDDDPYTDLDLARQEVSDALSQINGEPLVSSTTSEGDS